MKKIILGATATLMLVGAVVFANNTFHKKSADCCKPGAACCIKGSPCCTK